MYYGEYAPASAFAQSQRPGDSISTHARCWTLGDKLLYTDFKNYAMGHLHHQHTTAFPRKLVTTQDVNYACENSVADSNLRKFYFAFVIEHFDNPDRLQGSTEEWDDLWLAHADLRLLLLQNLRMAVEERATVSTIQIISTGMMLLYAAKIRLYPSQQQAGGNLLYPGPVYVEQSPAPLLV
jgi:hypothetical protein